MRSHEEERMERRRTHQHIIFLPPDMSPFLPPSLLSPTHPPSLVTKGAVTLRNKAQRRCISAGRASQYFLIVLGSYTRGRPSRDMSVSRWLYAGTAGAEAEGEESDERGGTEEVASFSW